MIAAFGPPKGGVGKSTIASNFGVWGFLAGYRTAIVDADPQASILAWSELRTRPGPDIISLQPADLEAWLDANAERYDLVILDTPAHDWSAFALAIAVADLTVVVSSLNAFDLTVAIKVRDVLVEFQRPYAILMNKVGPRWSQRLTIWAEVYRALGVVIEPPITHLVAFPDAVGVGMSVHEYEPGGRADVEAEQAFEWIIAKLEAQK